jgi:hypothetical protein
LSSNAILSGREKQGRQPAAAPYKYWLVGHALLSLESRWDEDVFRYYDTFFHRAMSVDCAYPGKKPLFVRWITDASGMLR